MKYFAYGSNMNPNRTKERGINFSKREHAIFEGWRLKFNKVASMNSNEGYTNIEKDDESVVEGILYTIQDADIEKLDRYEGYPNHYRKLKVRVKLDNGEEEEAITYVANPGKVREELKPSKDYLNHLLKGSDLLSEEYCKKLRKWETLD
ncbi:MAG: gamma-glutamylcyclotransferase family protein [Promethearchaeota archaeon]